MRLPVPIELKLLGAMLMASTAFTGWASQSVISDETVVSLPWVFAGLGAVATAMALINKTLNRLATKDDVDKLSSKVDSHDRQFHEFKRWVRRKLGEDDDG